MSPQDRLLQILRTYPAAEVQNKLMTSGDREIALSMLYLSEGDRDFILSFLGQQKSERVREEWIFQKGVRITYSQYLQAVNNILDRFLSSGSGKMLKSYLRPVRRSRRS